MILGSKDSFAIEFEVDPIPQGASEEHIKYMRYFILGRMCFWVNHQQIGDYDLGGSLSVAAADLPTLLEKTGRRYAPALNAESAEKAFHTINDALYIDKGQPDEQVRQDWKTYSGFIAIPMGFDVFDEWKAFLVEGDQKARYLWLNYDEGVVHEAILAIGEFEACIQEFLDWFDEYFHDSKDDPTT